MTVHPHEQMIRRYFQAWLEQDPAPLEEIFAENAVYSECYGPEYRGLSQIKRWFEDWNQKGKVLEWRIKGFLHDGNRTAVEWYFRCDYEGEAGFDGVSLIEFDSCDKIDARCQTLDASLWWFAPQTENGKNAHRRCGKIVSLKEFQSKAEHEFPYGKGEQA